MITEGDRSAIESGNEKARSLIEAATVRLQYCSAHWDDITTNRLAQEISETVNSINRALILREKSS